MRTPTPPKPPRDASTVGEVIKPAGCPRPSSSSIKFPASGICDHAIQLLPVLLSPPDGKEDDREDDRSEEAEPQEW